MVHGDHPISKKAHLCSAPARRPNVEYKPPYLNVSETCVVLFFRSLGLEVRFLCFSWERATVKKYPRQIWDQQNQVPGMTKNWSQGLCVHSTKLRAWSLVCPWQAASEWVSEWRFLGRRCEDKVAMVSDPLIANWVLTSRGVENPI